MQTMKFLRYLTISIFLLIATHDSKACWGGWYAPSGYYMYWVYNDIPRSGLNIEDCNSDVGKNCKEWQELTSKDIPLWDIYDVVYNMSLEKFEAIYDNRSVKSNNEFVKWIIQRDTEILDFLLLAKTNEYIRQKRNSRWYYPSMKIEARMTIEEVAKKALSVDDGRLKERYLLQAVRALFSMGKYDECIVLWENQVSHLSKDNLMRQLIHPYIAGAEFRIGHSREAIRHFAESGDIESVLFCAEKSGEKLSKIDALELVCKYAPDSECIEKTLQSYVRTLEPLGDFYWDEKFKMTPETQKLYSLCLNMARNGQTQNPAMWYYTASFLADLNNEVTKADYLLGLAEKSKSSEYIDESIEVFRIYLDAKLKPYNAAYEERLFSQLKWLDSKICNNIDDKVRKETANGYKLLQSHSYYYWNDMMRRILLAEVCPRMIETGKTTRALQLANMAENRLLGLVDKRVVHNWTDDAHKTETYAMSAYRYSENYNLFDYRNHFFEMIDSLGVDIAIKYVQNVWQNRTSFDTFLNTRGYIGDDYLNDILGTQCLRNMRYTEAVKYLGSVSEAYKNHLNVELHHDPFSFNRKKVADESDFKYNFAREMCSLEQSINLTKEPNRKAQLMIKFAIGLENSFDRCWSLTQYYRGSSYWGQVCEKRDWETDGLTKAAICRAKKLTETACSIVTDDEVAADIHYELCRYKTIAEKYPNTERGIFVKGHCDNLRDYYHN